MKNWLILVALLLFPAWAEGKTWYAGTGGSNTNTCNQAESFATPKLTISAGVACMTAEGGTGHTLFITAGTYNEPNSSINVPSGTDLGSGANTIAARSGPGTVTLSPDNPFNTYNGNFHHVIFDGLRWSGGDGLAFAGGLPAHHLRFTNFEVTSFAVQGFLLGGQGGNEFINGSIHDASTGNDQNHGIYMASSNNIVERVNFSNIPGYCIQIYVSPAQALSNNILRFNTFSNCNTFQAKSEVVVYYGDNNQVYGNIFKNGRPGGQGMSVGTASTTNLKVYNNTFYNYGGACFYSDNNSPGSIEFKNNICSNTGPIVNAGSGSVTYATNLCSSAGTGCAFVENPAITFTNATAGNFTLKDTGSAAVNNGTNLGSSYSPDLASVARPTTGPWEIGAYEYGAVVIPPPVSQLVLALPLDEGTGSTAVDVSGQKNNATLVGGATWDVSGKYGKAVMFDGTGRLNIPTSASLAVQGMTLEAWIYPTTAPASQFFSIIFKDTYYLYASSESGYCPAPTLAPLGGYSTTTTARYLCATSLPPVNQWSHLAVTHDGATTNFYLNGAIIASQTATDPMISSSYDLMIGASVYGENFVGKIDEPRVYSYARTPAQIVSDMNTPLIGLPGKYVEIAPATSVEISSASSIEIGAD